MRCALIWLLLLGTLAPCTRLLAAQASREELQAAYLYRFLEFVEFPYGQRTGDGAFCLCVVGDDKLATLLQNLVRGKSIAGRAITVLTSPDPRDIRNCHLLFATGRKNLVASELAPLKTEPVLTVSDLPDLPPGAAVILLRMKNEHLQFAIDVDDAKRRGLSISSRLIQLSRSFE